MILNIAYIFVFFIEMLIACIFFGNLSEKKHSFAVTLMIGGALFEIGAVINIFLIKNALINVFFSIVATFAFSLICFNIKKLRCLFYSAVLIAISTIFEIFCILFSPVMSNLHSSDIGEAIYLSDHQAQINSFIGEIVLSKAIYFLFVTILLKFIKEDNSISKIPLSFYIYPVSSTVSTVFFWFIITTEEIEYTNQIILAFVSVLLFVSTLFMFFAYQNHAQKEKQILMLQQEKEKIRTDIAYYNILEQQNINLRAYAHDTKNHLSAIKNLNTNPEIDVYISKMSESLANYSKVSHSGNHTLDVIIDKYVTECKIDGLSFDFDVKNNNLSTIEHYDLVAVLGNLLDNAVDAAKKSSGKSVTLETDFRNNFSVIIISNSCDKNPMSYNYELSVTTKSNKRLHGFGLKSVKNTVKKYNGDIAFEYNEDAEIFVVTVMIAK